MNHYEPTKRNVANYAVWYTIIIPIHSFSIFLFLVKNCVYIPFCDVLLLSHVVL